MLICVQVGISRGTTWVGLKIRKIENVLFYVDLSVCVFMCMCMDIRRWLKDREGGNKKDRVPRNNLL